MTVLHSPAACLSVIASNCSVRMLYEWRRLSGDISVKAGDGSGVAGLEEEERREPFGNGEELEYKIHCSEGSVRT